MTVRRTDALVLLLAVACLDLPFAVLMRLGAPSETVASAVGLIALTVVGGVAVALALRERAQGGWVLAIALPASLAAGWCVAASLALQGGMHFVHLWGVFSRGTDPDWMKVLSIVALAHGVIVGPLLAMVLRVREQTLVRPSRDGADRMAAWALGVTALVAAGCTLVVRSSGAAVTFACVFGLCVLSWRSTRFEAFVRGLGRSGVMFLGPVVEGVPRLVHGAPVEGAVWEMSSGGPYRQAGEEALPVALVSARPEDTVRPLRRRRWAMLATACGTLAFSLFALSASR